MATNGQVTAKADFATNYRCILPCHFKVKMTRNVKNNNIIFNISGHLDIIRNEFNVPTSVELEVSHSHNTLNKNK